MQFSKQFFSRLEALISLGLSTDESTQEYATEAIAEMLTVPAIQVGVQGGSIEMFPDIF